MGNIEQPSGDGQVANSQKNLLHKHLEIRCETVCAHTNKNIKGKAKITEKKHAKSTNPTQNKENDEKYFCAQESQEKWEKQTKQARTQHCAA